MYPSMPIDNIPDNTYSRFMSQIAPMYNQSRIPQIGQQMMGQSQPQQFNNRNFNNFPNSDGSMNVVLGDQGAGPRIAERILGVNRNPATEYQQGELAMRQREIERKTADDANSNKIANSKLANDQVKTSIAADKAKYQGSRIVAPKGGSIKLIAPDGKILADYGPSGTMSEEERVLLDQTNTVEQINKKGEVDSGNAEKLAKLKADQQIARDNLALEHQKALDDYKQTHNTGTTTKTSVTDASGTSLGERTTTVTPNKSKTGTVMMYGPQGQGPYPIPADKVEDAKKTKQMSLTKPLAKAK